MRRKVCWRSARRTGGCGRSAWTRLPPPSFCRTISTRWHAQRLQATYCRIQISDAKTCARLHLRHRVRRRRAGARSAPSCGRASPSGTRATTRRSSTSRFPGAPPPTDIRRRLVDAGIVENDITMRAALLWSRQGGKLKAGEYRFDRPLSALEVIDRLVRGEVYTRRVTFREGLTIAEMARRFRDAGAWTAADFVAAAKNVIAHCRSRSGRARPRRLSVSGDLYRVAFDVGDGAGGGHGGAVPRQFS